MARTFKHSEKPFDDQVAAALNNINAGLTKLGRLKERAKKEGLVPGGHSALAFALHGALCERGSAFEARQVVEEARRVIDQEDSEAS